MLSTASLMERPEPYHLQVELARGTLNRLRNQIAGWELFHISVPQEVRDLVHTASEQLSMAVTRREDSLAAADRAMLATAATLEAIDRLTAAYVEQALAARHQQGGKLNTLLGVNLGPVVPDEAMTRQILPAFNTAIVPLAWRAIEVREGKRDWTLYDRQIDWCRAGGMKICSGPLLAIDKWSLPDWMYLWGEEEADSFRSCVAEHIEAVGGRYRGKVQLWQCAAGLNIKNDFAQAEEERLRLAVLCLESIRRVDPRTPVVIALDQPWGSFMARDDHDLSPLHFADALVRGDLGLAGIGLEINFGYSPRGTDARDVLEFGRQIDRYGTLGLPLLVSLTVPSAATRDSLAQDSSKVQPYSPLEPSPAAQRAWAERYLPLLLAKQPVQGVIWNQLTDSQPHALAHGGLFDANDRPKPIVELLESLRQQHVV
jgi:hypothetical protein